MAHNGDDSLITMRVDRFGAGTDGDASGVLPDLGHVEARGLVSGRDGVGDGRVISLNAVPGRTPGLCHLDDGCWLASFVGHVAVFLVGDG